MEAKDDRLAIIDLGRLGYREAYERQIEAHGRVLADREAAQSGTDRPVGRVLLVEHEPVITVSRRQGAGEHVLAGAETLGRMGVGVEPTDRGGDVTYHGPGQLVAYPILDLNRLGLRLHDYLRLLEEAVIRSLDAFGVRGARDPAATGVWVRTNDPDGGAKIAAMGVRVRKWITMHGLALNVDPNMKHFGLIVPCGLAGRPVTSLRDELGEAAPTMDAVKGVLRDHLVELLRDAESTSGVRAAGDAPRRSPPA